MEGEDIVRTVDCLRGRLLAERAASRNAQEESQILQNKMMELEELLKQEAKSRKRAEKKLQFLMKKLESITIQNQETRIHEPSSSSSENQTSSLEEEALLPRLKDASSPQGNATFEDSLSYSSSVMDQQSDYLWCPSIRSSSGDEEGHDLNSQVDDSMALVVVDAPSSRRIDPYTLDDTVRGVLDTLQRAKAELRSSMERRRMMKMMRVGVGEVNLAVKTSTTIFI